MSKNGVQDVFRRWGYLQANIDSFGRLEPFPHEELAAQKGKDADKLRSIYCGSIGVEFMHMPFPKRTDWIAAEMEREPAKVDQPRVLKRILAAEAFERFIHTRYVGSKRFSLEGLAALIPLLDSIIDQAAETGFETVLIGMSHRGRLTTLYTITNVPAQGIFSCFEDVDPKSLFGSGDVKYHRGATGIYQTSKGREVKVHLASNPSHLEAVNPVIVGRTRAKQERMGDSARKKALAILIHGDAAFAGQGIVAETLNLADVNGFTIGGTVNIVVNNLIGFTAPFTSTSSSRFMTDVAKRLPIPIWHVNAEDPDAVVRVGEMAMKYRAEFSSEVVIDLLGYRRYGHNEGDDPTFTSPVLYDRLKNQPYLFQAYAKQIGLSEAELKQLEESEIEKLNRDLEVARQATKQPTFFTPAEYWNGYFGGAYEKRFEVPTNVSREEVATVAERLTTVPKDFTVHPKLAKLLEQRAEMARGERPVDWGMAETLAYATLVNNGTPVRITGQDSRRGTFSHRHAVLVDAKNGTDYSPLANIHPKQGSFQVYDTILSEAACVGFEYGYSREFPEALVCWEAQFGDFVNGAQILIDQYLTAAEDKWGLLSGLVLLLPHGYEGQGPEHSSARIERFLQLAGEDNIQVCQPSTSAQHFHLLRRQALRKWRKPLIVATPKSMLRLPASCSSIESFVSGRFENVIGDEAQYENAERLLVCSGKIVHELRSEREKRGEKDVAIITLEQLYPFPEEDFAEVLDRFPNMKSITWVQEEPANMGALSYVRPFIEQFADIGSVSAVRRSVSASPATGSLKAHELEQKALVKLAFASPRR